MVLHFHVLKHGYNNIQCQLRHRTLSSSLLCLVLLRLNNPISGNGATNGNAAAIPTVHYSVPLQYTTTVYQLVHMDNSLTLSRRRKTHRHKKFYRHNLNIFYKLDIH